MNSRSNNPTNEGGNPFLSAQLHFPFANLYSNLFLPFKIFPCLHSTVDFCIVLVLYCHSTICLNLILILNVGEKKQAPLPHHQLPAPATFGTF